MKMKNIYLKRLKNLNRTSEVSMSDLVKKAREFAIQAHWGQMYGTKPYLFHLEEVARICKCHQLPECVEAAAYLHDVVEDTDVHADQISAEFGYEVATLVYSVTDAEVNINFDKLAKEYNNRLGLKDDADRGRRDAKTYIRQQKKSKTYPKILSHPYGVHLKLADRMANVSSCSTAKDTKMFDMYCKEASGFESALKTPGVAENMWADLDSQYGKYKAQGK